MPRSAAARRAAFDGRRLFHLHSTPFVYLYSNPFVAVIITSKSLSFKNLANNLMHGKDFSA